MSFLPPSDKEYLPTLFSSKTYGKGMHGADDDLERVHRLNKDEWLSSYQPVCVFRDNAEDVRRDEEPGG